MQRRVEKIEYFLICPTIVSILLFRCFHFRLMAYFTHVQASAHECRLAHDDNELGKVHLPLETHTTITYSHLLKLAHSHPLTLKLTLRASQNLLAHVSEIGEAYESRMNRSYVVCILDPSPFPLFFFTDGVHGECP